MLSVLNRLFAFSSAKILPLCLIHRTPAIKAICASAYMLTYLQRKAYSADHRHHPALSYNEIAYLQRKAYSQFKAYGPSTCLASYKQNLPYDTYL